MKATLTGAEQRAYWVDALEKIALPVFANLAQGTLRKTMPVQCSPNREGADNTTHLEAFGRALAGIAPWLDAGALAKAEESRRAAMSELVKRSLDSATDPKSPDCLDFSGNGQALVDGAFLAQGLILSRRTVWEQLEDRVRRNVVNCLKSTRSISPPWNNWLLFSAIIEAFLRSVGEDWDGMRIDYAIRQHEQWYKGDGAYGDGQFFHWDYYNSFVIQPMLLLVLDLVGDVETWKPFRDPFLKRARRFAAIQERFIATDGSFPAIGRSLTYRFGVFQHLSLMALRADLPEELPPAQARCALTAVLERVIAPPATFDRDGWLSIGLCGSQPSLGEYYISTGSLYICCCGLLALGLAPDTAFWSGAAQRWTAQKVWSGEDLPCDHCMDDRLDRPVH